MPLPEPRTGEAQSDFISRCMGDDTMVQEYPDEDQRNAVCFSQWRRDHSDSSRFRMKADDRAEILIYEDIGEDFWFGGISAKGFKDELDKLGGGLKTLDVRINSMGGSVFEGITIYNLLRSHKATVNVWIDGMAASIASVIAMAGDEIIMAHNAWMMIHDPVGLVMGSADDMRGVADQLEGIKGSLVDTYQAKTGMDTGEIAKLMTDETWMEAESALNFGFADKIDERDVALAAYASPLLKSYRHVPVELSDRMAKPAQPMRNKRVEEMKARMAQGLRQRKI